MVQIVSAREGLAGAGGPPLQSGPPTVGVGSESGPATLAPDSCFLSGNLGSAGNCVIPVPPGVILVTTGVYKCGCLLMWVFVGFGCCGCNLSDSDQSNVYPKLYY